MNHKREIPDHTDVEALFLSNIWQPEVAGKLYSLKRLLRAFFFF